MARNLNRGIWAVIVTFNSGGKIPSLASIASQVERVVVVDNGSEKKFYQETHNYVTQFPRAILLKNDENAGIAAALNRGVRYAKSKGCRWIVTLDDDSTAAPDMVQKLLSAHDKLPANIRAEIGILAPNYANAKGTVYKFKNPTIVPTAITSGQLVDAGIYDTIGFYKEELFVSYVDHEFCFRAGTRGIRTLLVPNVLLRQRLGTPSHHKFFGKQFLVPHYSPARYYYTYRNSIYLYIHYFPAAPIWMLKDIWSNILSYGKILLFEDKKWEKTRATARGYIDGFRGIYGKARNL